MSEQPSNSGIPAWDPTPQPPMAHPAPNGAPQMPPAPGPHSAPPFHPGPQPAVTPPPAPAGPPPAAQGSSLDGLFADDRGSQRLLQLLRDPRVQDVRCNRHDRVFYTDDAGTKIVDRLFAGPKQYTDFIDQLMQLTDVGYQNLASASTSVIEGSFRKDRTDIKGSLIVVTSEVTREEPALVVRKQPDTVISLDKMLEQQMLTVDMRLFLEYAVRGRLNILISGGSGAGKTTLARALSWYIDPSHRVLTCEEIDELHLDDRLPNVVSMTTFRELDTRGQVMREERLEDLVRHGLRMRGDRIWVGETRGKEAYALVKACLSGHDGSVTTIHANDAGQAVDQLISYVMESHLTEEPARDQVRRAFHLAVQVQQVRLGRRVITEIVELENVREGNHQRRNKLWEYDMATDTWARVGRPTPRLRAALARYGVNYDELEQTFQQPTYV